MRDPCTTFDRVSADFLNNLPALRGATHTDVIELELKVALVIWLPLRALWEVIPR